MKMMRNYDEARFFLYVQIPSGVVSGWRAEEEEEKWIH